MSKKLIPKWLTSCRVESSKSINKTCIMILLIILLYFVLTLSVLCNVKLQPTQFNAIKTLFAVSTNPLQFNVKRVGRLPSYSRILFPISQTSCLAKTIQTYKYHPNKFCEHWQKSEATRQGHLIMGRYRAAEPCSLYYIEMFKITSLKRK